MTATAWMAQVPTRTEAERKADRDELLNELKAAREELGHEDQRRARNARAHGAKRTGDVDA